MKILAFAASLRKESLNKKLVELAVTAAKSNNAEVTLIDLNGFTLPPYDNDLEISGQFPENAKQLGVQISSHDALMIASPEYNNSMPGHFKNTFDWVSRLRPIPFKGKPVLLMSASPGLVGGNRGLWALRIPFEACGSFVYPEMFSLSSAQEAFYPTGQLKDEKLLGRLKDTVHGFVTFSEKLSKLNE